MTSTPGGLLQACPWNPPGRSTASCCATRAIRALAHPTRLSLYLLVGRDGPVTAADAARQLDISQALASHHLREITGVRQSTLYLTRDELAELNRAMSALVADAAPVSLTTILAPLPRTASGG